MPARSVDAVILGGGIIGASIAFHLVARSPGLRVVVLERQPELGTGATAKATGGIRHQFSTAANVRLSQLSYPEFLTFAETHGQEIGFRAHGYLFVSSSQTTWDALRASAEVQRGLGVPTRVLEPGAIAELYPPLRTEDLVGATFCALDASANPSDALHGYVRSARARGVEFVTGAPALAIETGAGAVTGVRTAECAYATDVVVDAAGPHVAEVAALVGVEVPAKPFRRQVFVMGHDARIPTGLPMLIDLDTGWYAHQEGSGRLLFAGTDKDSRPGLDPVVDWEGFDAVARAALARVPAVAERATVVGAYAGIRTLTPDHHAILGAVPQLRGFFLATACNGHGFMHAPAVGTVLSELIVDGRAHSLDLSPFSLSRFAAGQAADETTTF